MAEQQQSDPTGRIPGLRGLSERARQLVMLVLALIVMVGMGVLLFANSTPSAGGTDTPYSAAPVSTQRPGVPGDSVPPDGRDVGPAPSESASSAGQSPPAEPADDREQDQGPATEATGGPLGPAERQKVTTLINTVVPAWSEADFAGRPGSAGNDRAAQELTRKWVARWRDEERVTSDFTAASTHRFNELWGGAIQMAATVSDAEVTDARLVENYGAESYWKVQVERTVAAPGIKQTEELTWYFMIKNDPKGPLLDEFYLPSDIADDDPEGGHDHG